MGAISGQKDNETAKNCILFTGTGERMIENVMEFMPQVYDVVHCPPAETDFYRAMRKSNPKVLIICLQNETREQLRMYDSLYADDAYASLPVIVIGYEDDCAQFRNRLPLKNLKMLQRPLNRDAFLAELECGVKEMNEQLERHKPQSKEQEPEQAIEKEEGSGEDKQMSEKEMLESERKLTQKIERSMRFYGRKTVLVVDDDVNMLNVIKLYLQDLYDVTVVPSGKLALKYIEKKNADIVLLDYMMPEMDGPEVLQYIRQESTQKNVPVVFLTGVSDKESVMRGLEFRPNGYLLKPVSREALLEKVTEVVLGI